MNLKSMSRGALAAVVSTGMALGLASCTRDYTASFVYVMSAKSNPGVVTAYAVDYQTGALTQRGTSVTAGANPINAVAAPNGLFIYVLNQGDSTVQEFAVAAGQGELTSKNLYPATKSASGPQSPVAAAIDGAGKFLYVAYTYLAGSSGPGAVLIYPINADNSLGTPTTVTVGNNPIGIVASAQFCVSSGVSTSNPTCTITSGTTGNVSSFVYVLDQEPAVGTTVSAQGVVLGYSQNASTGVLTPITGGNAIVNGISITNGFRAGVVPSAITEDPTARYVYVTDQSTNQLIGYLVLNGGTLSAMINGPFVTGLFPVAVTVDPRGEYLYTANRNADTISAYALNVQNGTPTATSGGSGVINLASPGPTCITIEPALGLYVYTSNIDGGAVSAAQLDPHNGGLTLVENQPYNTPGNPTCVISVANGTHALQVVNP
jgi:6-phosphogluconolactonase